MPVGVFDSRIPAEEQTTDAEWMQVIEEFTASIARFDAADPNFNEAYGTITVTQDQPSLRRITWDINWLSADGEAETFKRFFFLHGDSMYWEQYGLRDFSFLQSQGGE